MRICFALGAGLLAVVSSLNAQRITAVEPDSAKAGDTVSAKGDGVDKSAIDTIYLTDGKNDLKCEVTEQSATAIKFKVPAGTKPGRWTVMVHTTKDQLLEQPVKLTVE